MLPEDVQIQAPLLLSAVEQAAESVVITEAAPLDPPGPRIIYVNPSFTELTGYEADEVVGKTPRLLQGPKTEPWVLRRLRRRLEEEAFFEGEAINYRKDGSPYINHWSISPVRAPDGTVSHWVSVQRDVTERRRTNERLLMVQERERQRIAREMHDEIGGVLTSLQITLNQLRSVTEATPRTGALFDTLTERIDALSDLVRTLTDEASPRVLQDYGLAKGVSRLVRRLASAWDLEVSLHNEVTDNERLSSLLELVVYRILREGLSNVGRHADAETVQVLLNKVDGQLRLHIVDDGTGFDPARDLDGNEDFGLLGIKERVERLNGDFSISTAPGEGTRLTVTLPLVTTSLL